jgi:hypothetical protein
MEITEVFSVDDEEVVVSEEIVQAAKIATESLLPSKSRDKYEKKNAETLWTGLKLRKSKTSVPKMLSLPIFWKNQKNIQQLLSGQLLAGGKNFYSPRAIIH